MRQLRKDVRQKLQNRSGASVLLALVVMLVAVLASTVVLRAAVSNTGRLLPGEQEEQAYLTVSSAAAILRDELKAPGCSYNWVTTVYSTEGSTETTTERSTTPVSAELAFGPVLNEMIGEIYAGNESSTRTLAVTVNAAEGYAMDQVLVALTMESDYYLIADFSLAPVPGRDLDNRLRLTALGTKTDGGEVSGVSGNRSYTQTTETLKYSSVMVKKGGG